MSNQTVTARLRIAAHEISSLELARGCADVFVGRSRECLMRVPADELSVSGRHVRIFWRGRALCIEDAGSRNGIYSQGRRIKGTVKVSAGARFAVGDATLEFENPQKRVSAVPAEACHRLERLNGDAKGQYIQIEPKEGSAVFSIGLDPANDLCLPDLLVSRRHAFLEMKTNGSCWIRDNDSKNGTFVNREPLHGKERLLKDGDRISIAYFDFRFLDRTVPHTRLFFWVKLMAVVLALAVVSTVYLFWATARATVEDYLRLTRNQAAAEAFAEARQSLRAARMARDAEKFLPQIDMLDVQLERWEKTSAEWDEARGALEQARWGDAKTLLDRLNSGAVDAWAWNGTTALAAKRESEFASRALRLYYDATESLSSAGEGRPERQAERIAERLEPLTDYLASGGKTFAACTYLVAVTNRLAELEAEMKNALSGFARVDACIGRLDAVNPDFRNLVSELEGVQRDETANAAVRAYARKYAAPCRELAVAKAFIAAEFKALTAMEFASVIAKKEGLALPRKELCARHPRLSDHRGKLEGHHREAQEYARALDSMVSGLTREVFAQEAPGHRALAAVFAEKTWDALFRFGCLEKAPPSARREAAAGVYDDIVGIEYAYESLRALPDEYNERCLKMLGFAPQIRTAQRAMERIAAFVDYMDGQRAWLRKGALNEFLGSCRRLQSSRDRVVSFLSHRDGTRRERLIARFSAHYLSSVDDYATREALAKEFKVYQNEIQSLNDRYESESDPEKQIALRAAILKKGIPGDPVLHTKWVQKYEGNGL